MGSTTTTPACFLHVIICIRISQLFGIITLLSLRGWYSITRAANYEVLRSQQGLQKTSTLVGFWFLLGLNTSGNQLACLVGFTDVLDS